MASRRKKPATQDQEVARLTAKADLILTELDAVVRLMSQILREKARDDDSRPTG